jgi:hypothetical protein
MRRRRGDVKGGGDYKTKEAAGQNKMWYGILLLRKTNIKTVPFLLS